MSDHLFSCDMKCDMHIQAKHHLKKYQLELCVVIKRMKV